MQSIKLQHFIVNTNVKMQILPVDINVSTQPLLHEEDVMQRRFFCWKCKLLYKKLRHFMDNSDVKTRILWTKIQALWAYVLLGSSINENCSDSEGWDCYFLDSQEVSLHI